MSESGISESKLGKFQTLVDIVERLRAPAGCPWDREQTHATLKRNLLEECYEVLEAIDSGDPKRLAEELGDILVQVAFHGQIALEGGEFNLEEVLVGSNQKLVRRHPHVFGDVTVADAREVERNWEKLKEAERAGEGSASRRCRVSPKSCPLWLTLS